MRLIFINKESKETLNRRSKVNLNLICLFLSREMVPQVKDSNPLDTQKTYQPIYLLDRILFGVFLTHVKVLFTSFGK